MGRNTALSAKNTIRSPLLLEDIIKYATTGGTTGRPATKVAKKSRMAINTTFYLFQMQKYCAKCKKHNQQSLIAGGHKNICNYRGDHWKTCNKGCKVVLI